MTFNDGENAAHQQLGGLRFLNNLKYINNLKEK